MLITGIEFRLLVYNTVLEVLLKSSRINGAIQIVVHNNNYNYNNYNKNAGTGMVTCILRLPCLSCAYRRPLGTIATLKRMRVTISPIKHLSCFELLTSLLAADLLYTRLLPLGQIASSSPYIFGVGPIVYCSAFVYARWPVKLARITRIMKATRFTSIHTLG